jgi:hypothetical protein
MNLLRHSITAAAIASLALALLIAPAYAATDAAVRNEGPIAYASGGISEEGRENLNAIATDFNLKLVLATKSGAYLSDVGVVVSDHRGQRLIDAKSEGPWFYVRLPNGRYSIEASAHGTVVRKAVTVGPQRLSQVDFRWDD